MRSNSFPSTIVVRCGGNIGSRRCSVRLHQPPVRVCRFVELAPIERIWQKIKWQLRKHCQHSLASLKTVLDQAIRLVTRDDILQVSVSFGRFSLQVCR